VLNKQPIGMNFIVGSVTTYGDEGESNIPRFGVIEVDKENLLPISYATYQFDLEKANAMD